MPVADVVPRDDRLARNFSYYPWRTGVGGLSTFTVHGQEYSVGYLPAESDTGMFGGNSNWRGPVWFPINVILLRALLNVYAYAGDDFKVECPTGSGQLMTLHEVAQELSRRLTGIFTRGADGKRPVHGGQPILAKRPALARPVALLRVLPR